MKKRAVLLITAVCLAATCAFGLSGCGGQGKPKPKVTTVTEAEWKNAVETAANYTLKMPNEDFGVLTVEIGDGVSLSGGDAKAIYHKDGDTYVKDVFEEGSWSRDVRTEDSFTEALNSYTFILKAFKDDYSAFTYADGQYTAASIDKTETLYDTVENVTFKFEDGAVVGVTFEIDGAAFAIEKFGTTEIAYPVYTVTAEKWNAIFSGATEFTRIESSANNKSYTYHYKYSGNKVEKQEVSKYDGTVLEAHIYDGDGMAEYVLTGGVWYKSVMSAETWNEVKLGKDGLVKFKDDFVKFNYSVSSGEYSAEYIMKGEVNCYAPSITFVNGKLQSMRYTPGNGDVQHIFNSVGETVITVPAEFTEA